MSGNQASEISQWTKITMRSIACSISVFIETRVVLVCTNRQPTSKPLSRVRQSYYRAESARPVQVGFALVSRWIESDEAVVSSAVAASMIIPSPIP